MDTPSLDVTFTKTEVAETTIPGHIVDDAVSALTADKGLPREEVEQDLGTLFDYIDTKYGVENFAHTVNETYVDVHSVDAPHAAAHTG